MAGYEHTIAWRHIISIILATIEAK